MSHRTLNTERKVDMNQLQTVEGYMKSLCLALHITEAQHIQGTADERRRKLVKLTISALRELDGGGAAMGLEAPTGLSAEQERAANALTHRMGCYVPPELR